MDQRSSDIPPGAFLPDNISLGDAIHCLMLIMLGCAKNQIWVGWFGAKPTPTTQDHVISIMTFSGTISLQRPELF